METNERAGRGGMWAMWLCVALFALIVLSYFRR